MSDRNIRLQNVSNALRAVNDAIFSLRIFYGALPSDEAAIIARVASLDIDALIALSLGLNRTVSRVRDEIHYETDATTEDDDDVTVTP